MVYRNTVKQLFCANIDQEIFSFCDYDISYTSCKRAPLRMKCNLNSLNPYPNLTHNKHFK